MIFNWCQAVVYLWECLKHLNLLGLSSLPSLIANKKNHWFHFDTYTCIVKSQFLLQNLFQTIFSPVICYDSASIGAHKLALHVSQINRTQQRKWWSLSNLTTLITCSFQFIIDCLRSTANFRENSLDCVAIAATFRTIIWAK